MTPDARIFVDTPATVVDPVEVADARERARAVDTGVKAPPSFRRTVSGRRSGAFSVFASFAVTQENFDRVGEILKR